MSPTLMAELMQFFDAITTEITDLRHQVRALAARQERLDTAGVAAIVAADLRPELSAVRRAARIGRRSK
jgi:hypothetical protein